MLADGRWGLARGVGGDCRQRRLRHDRRFAAAAIAAAAAAAAAALRGVPVLQQPRKAGAAAVLRQVDQQLGLVGILAGAIADSNPLEGVGADVLDLRQVRQLRAGG